MTQVRSSLDPFPQVFGRNRCGIAVFACNADRAGLRGTVVQSFRLKWLMTLFVRESHCTSLAVREEIERTSGHVVRVSNE